MDDQLSEIKERQARRKKWKSPRPTEGYPDPEPDVDYLLAQLQHQNEQVKLGFGNASARTEEVMALTLEVESLRKQLGEQWEGIIAANEPDGFGNRVLNRNDLILEDYYYLDRLLRVLKGARCPINQD